MTEDRGWISIYRKIDEGRFWLKEKFTKGQAWIDLIMLANHQDTEVYVRGINIKLKRGDLFWSEVELSKRWKWSRNKTRNYLKDLQNHKEITRKIDNRIGVITVLNYDNYQQTKQQKVQQKVQQKDNKRYPNNNVNNVNKYKYINNFSENEKKLIEEHLEGKTIEDVAGKVVEAFNSILGKHYKDKNSFIKGLEKALILYSLDEIAQAIENIKYGYWKDIMTPTMLFQNKNPRGEPVNYIDLLINQKENYVRR